MDRRRRLDRATAYLAAIIGCALGLGIPLAVVAWITPEPTELRVARNEGALTSLLVDGDARVLVVDTENREALVEALGLLAPPWESGPDVIISSADDRTLPGLWEALVRGDPSVVIVAGVPGADPMWAAIEDECTTRGVQLRYVAGALTFSTRRASLTIIGPLPETDAAAAVVVRVGAVNVVIALDGDAPRIAAQVLVGDADWALAGARVRVTSETGGVSNGAVGLGLRERDVLRMRFEDGRVRMRGGAIATASAAEPTATDEEE